MRWLVRLRSKFVGGSGPSPAPARRVTYIGRAADMPGNEGRVPTSSTPAPEDVRAKLSAAAARLGGVAAKRDAVFEDLKKKYGGPDADPNKWFRHLKDMSRETNEAVPDDPWPELAPAFDALADAWLAATPEIRDAMTSELWTHKPLHDGHLGYPYHVQKTLGARRDALSMRRVAAVVALGRGGRDFRDTFGQMETFVRAARAGGIDPSPEFERVAAMASAADNFGYGNCSTRDALLRFARTK